MHERKSVGRACWRLVLVKQLWSWKVLRFVDDSNVEIYVMASVVDRRHHLRLRSVTRREKLESFACRHLWAAAPCTACLKRYHQRIQLNNNLADVLVYPLVLVNMFWGFADGLDIRGIGANLVLNPLLHRIVPISLEITTFPLENLPLGRAR